MANIGRRSAAGKAEEGHQDKLSDLHHEFQEMPSLPAATTDQLALGIDGILQRRISLRRWGRVQPRLMLITLTAGLSRS